MREETQMMNGKTLVCVDSYRKGVPRGRFYGLIPGVEVFDSMTQFLLKMEESLNHRQNPIPRTLSQMLETLDAEPDGREPRRGRHATFEIEVLFRQNTSWQGILRWREKRTEQSFRSVLELIRLMNDALSTPEETGLPQ